MNILDQQIISQNVAKTTQHVSESTENFNKYLEEGRAVYKESFFQIAVVAAGILSLSVTYVGYVTSITGGSVTYKWLLFVGWAGLTITVLGGLIRNYVYTQFGHWQMQIYRIEALVDQDKALLELAIKAPNQIANINSKDELEKYIRIRKSNLKKYDEGINYNQKWEKIYRWLWSLIEKSTLIGLGVGVVCIVIFAAINLP